MHRDGDILKCISGEAFDPLVRDIAVYRLVNEGHRALHEMVVERQQEDKLTTGDL